MTTSLPLAVEIVRDEVTPELRRIARNLSPDALYNTIGPPVKRLFQTHLLANGANKKDWPTTNFWPRAARATNLQQSPAGPLIQISQQGVRQRYLGGDISPVNKGALTIPISPQAYGHVASDFPGSFLLRTPKGAYIVQYTAAGLQKNRTARARLTSLFQFLFKLSPGVSQAPDPSCMPSDEEILDTAGNALLKKLAPES